MALLGFPTQLVSGPEILAFGNLSGPRLSARLVQNPSKLVGRFAPHHFLWVLDRFGAESIPPNPLFAVHKSAGMTTQQTHVQVHLTLNL